MKKINNELQNEQDAHICSITGKTYYGFGNNAYPFEGRCSDEANAKYVIPARLLSVSPEMIKEWGIETIKRAVAEKAKQLGWEFPIL